MELFILISIILLLITILWFYNFSSPFYQMKIKGKKIPGPRSWPILGNSLSFMKTDCILQTFIELNKIYGPVFRLWIGKDLIITLENPDDIKVILTSTKHLNKSDQYRYGDFWLGNKNMLMGDENIWSNHRNLLNPSFHIRVIESFLETFKRNTAILCELLQVKVDEEEFDILPHLEKCSLDIICETALGVKVESQKLGGTPYLDAVKNLTNVILKRLTSPWLHNEHIFKLTSIGKKSYADAKYTKNFVYKIIQERKINLEKELECDINKDGKVAQRRAKPFLDYILLESNFSDEEIDSEVQSLMFAGHDTTMTTTAFCIYALSQHLDMQEKIYQEIQDLFNANNKEELSFDDYNNKMRYLDNVLKETMRMYPTLPFISRKVSEDVLLPSGFTLPKGSLANLLIYQLHKDEKYFPDPDVFIPERFEKNEDKVNFTFIPFSAGKRSCIGQKFAMLEMKVIIVALVQKYKFLPSEKVKTLMMETRGVLVSLNKHPIRLTLREHDADPDL